jgi:hypothetical protein
MTLKALLQEGSFHFELRNTKDVDGLEQTLRGFEDMQPLSHYLKRLHVNLFFSKRQRYLDVWYYFCDYFGKHLKGTLTDFALECRPRTVKNVEEITASKAISNLKGLITCNILFDNLSRTYNEDLLRHFVQSSEQFVHAVVVVGWKPTGTFRFMDLPTEIQMIILQYVLVSDEVLHRGPRSWVHFELTQDVGWHSHSCCMCSMLKHRIALTANTACDCLRYRSWALGIMLKPNKSSFVDLSPVPIFLVSKYMHALGGPIFFSQNKFAFNTRELCRLRDTKRPFVSAGFPTRHIERVRHLSIKLEWWHPPDSNRTSKQFKHLAEDLKKTFQHVSVDLTSC